MTSVAQRAPIKSSEPIKKSSASSEHTKGCDAPSPTNASCPEGCCGLRMQGGKHITEAKDAEEASTATAAAARDTEGVVAKEAEAVMARRDQAAEAAPAVPEVKEEAGAAAERAASEQDASTSGRETVPGQTSP